MAEKRGSPVHKENTSGDFIMTKEAKDKPKSEDEIQRLVLAEIKSAEDNRSAQTSKREKNWDRYYGRKLGNEKKGRSQFITRDVMDTIEWMMPFFMKTFAAGDPKIVIEIKGQEPFVGKALMDKIQVDLSSASPSIFYLFYQWFKDALVSNTAFVKVGWDLDQKIVTAKFDNLSRDNLSQLENDPDAEIIEIEEQANPFFESTFKVTAKIKQIIKDTIFAENTPHWEFLVSSRARDINDEHGKGQKTEVTLDYLKRINRANKKDGEDYFKHLDELDTDDSQDLQVDSLSAEKTQYMGDDQGGEVDYTEKGMIEFKEWYTRLDIDNDGYLEDVVCFMASDKLIRHEINKEGFMPFSAIRPIIDCYKFNGIAWAELIVEIQNLKTMLFRRILDNFDFQVSGRWRVDPDGSVDLHALYNHTPGGAIAAKQGALEDISPKGFDPNSFAIIEYVDSLKEQRTGMTRYNQGTDADSLNRTATGVIAIQSAAMQRIELVARIFAEGLRDFYRKVALLYQQYSKPFTAKVYGQEKEITPEMLQGRVVCKVNMGVQASVGMEEAQKIERMLAFLLKINEQYPGLLTPGKIHNLCTRYISSMGFQQVDDFIADLQSYMQEVGESARQREEMQKQMMEFEKKLKQMELSIKGKEATTRSQKVESDAYLKEKELSQDGTIEQRKLAQDKEIEYAKIDQDEKDSIRDFKVDRMNLLLKARGDSK